MLIIPAPYSRSTTSSSMFSPTSSTPSDSNADSLANEASTRSNHQLQPWLPITYNETTLRCLNGRPQVWTLNSQLLPLPNNPESDSDHSLSDYGDQEEESPMSCTTLQTIAQEEEAPSNTGRVTNDTEPQDHMRSRQCSSPQ